MTPDDITPRDWFAAHALSTDVVWKAPPDWEIKAIFGEHASGIRNEQIAAARAYAIADAMISERQKKRT